MLQSVSKRDYVRYVCYLSEMGIVQMKKNSEHGGKPVTCQTIVIDMEGLSMRQMGYKPCKCYNFNFLAIINLPSYIYLNCDRMQKSEKLV
jgi:hypothetical protein